MTGLHHVFVHSQTLLAARPMRVNDDGAVLKMDLKKLPDPNGVVCSQNLHSALSGGLESGAVLLSVACVLSGANEGSR